MTDTTNEADRPLAPENQTRAEATNAILSAIDGVSRRIDGVTSRLDDHDEEFRSIRRAIHGTSKAPPPGASLPLIDIVRDADKKGSDAAFDVAELRGELLAVRAELTKQSGVMGIGKKGLSWLVSPAGAKVAVQLATLAGVAYAAFHAAGH